MKSMKERRKELDDKRENALIQLIRSIVVEELGNRKTELVTQVPMVKEPKVPDNRSTTFPLRSVTYTGNPNFENEDSVGE